MQQSTFALRTSTSTYRPSGYFRLSKSAPWYSRFGWWLAKSSLEEEQAKVTTYTWQRSKMKKVTSIFLEAMKELGDKDWGFHPQDYIFLCGPELFDRALAEKGVLNPMTFMSDRCHQEVKGNYGTRVMVTDFGFSITVVPHMDGYAVVKKDWLKGA